MRAAIVTMSVLALAAGAGCSSAGGHANASGTSTTTTVASRPLDRAVAVPVVTGPVTGGQPDAPMNAMLASYKSQYGYSESEYFIEGRATSYHFRGAVPEDGKWSVTPGARAPYKTRLIVRVPTDPKKFNGTVVVEWLNVTAGRDSDPDFGFAGPELLRDGFAYVGVTAQKGGVAGGGFKLPIPGYDPKPLTTQNPARYGSLHHPGDDFSYDIFSQAAQAIVHPNGPSPLGALHPQRLIAAGESQSAGFMVTYVDALEPVAHIYDGFVIHSRGGSGAKLDSHVPDQLPGVVHIRTDLRVPVMMLATETDLFGLGFYASIQPDTDLIRTWQMAGTAHADQSTLDYGVASGRQWDKTSLVPDFSSLCGRINDGQQRYVVRAAFAAMQAWVANGKQPAHAPAIAVTGGNEIARDAHGNALGGIRTPAVDAPTEALSGTLAPGKSAICSLFGSATPFGAALLKQLYPTHADYVAEVTSSAAAAVNAGFLLPADEREIVRRAQSAPVPGSPGA